MPEIKDVLQDMNPWWKEEYIVDFKEREVYQKIQKFIPLAQMLAFTGLRRVGKTTLMRKIAIDAIQGGYDAADVVYFSFDEFRNTEIREVIRVYEVLMEKDFRNGKRLLLLDEIQKLEKWEEQLKGIYDAFGKNVKIIISGSESLFIRKKSKETLAGRLFEFKVEPLSFKEFLHFRGVDFKPKGIYERELGRLFHEFTLTMGFPELVGVQDKDIIKKYVKESLVEKVIYRDAVQLFKVRDVSILEALLNIFLEEPGQLVETGALAKELHISRQTASLYLRYLEDSFLIKRLYNFSKSKRKTERKLKKYYPTVLSPDLLFRKDDISRSKVFEWQIVNQLQAAFFWRDTYKNEVDVVTSNGKPVPIEIKYGKVEFKGLLAFMKKFRCTKGYVISPDKEGEQKFNGKTVSIVPAYKFLLK